ncbi:MAG: AAA family ATPase [Thermofilum sp.]|uniref:MoxR family ATPase n=1 Tax=Thermofilum sp. TaxID=1961369 RepID=UPI003161DB65
MPQKEERFRPGLKISDLFSLEDKFILIGPPGVGKTERIRQLARDEALSKGRQFVDLSEDFSEEIVVKVKSEPGKYYLFLRIPATHFFPEDVQYPVVVSGRGFKHLIPEKLELFTLQNVAGVIFIDELNNVQDDKQITALFTLIQEKEFGWGYKLAKDVKVVSAGNPSEWSAVARELPAPLVNRMTVLEVEPPSVEEWSRYMDSVHGDNYEKLVVAYLMVYRDDLLKPPVNPGEPFPSPRAWTELALLLKKYSNAPDKFKEALVYGRVGGEAGAKFMSLLRTRIDVARVLAELKSSPEKFDELDINAKILVVHALTQQRVKEYEKIIVHIVRRHREFAMLLIVMGGSKMLLELMSIASVRAELTEMVKKLTAYIQR